MRILLTLSYLGTAYCGFQVQPNGITVQQKLQDAIESVYGLRCPLTGCSRTDSGVHADMFCCTVDVSGTTNLIPTERVCGALNHFLPDDISINDAREVPDDFHVRHDVKSKEYIYLIWNSRSRNPFLVGRALHYPRPLNAALMNDAAGFFVGRHDFAAFCSAGSSATDTTREIYSCSVAGEGEKISVDITGNGFLYNMVRIITGTLISVSEGKIQAEDIPSIIESRDRARAGFTAPPQGLYLHRVDYR